LAASAERPTPTAISCTGPESQGGYVTKLFAAKIKLLKGSSPLKTRACFSCKTGDWFSVPLAGLGAALHEKRGVRFMEPP